MTRTRKFIAGCCAAVACALALALPAVALADEAPGDVDAPRAQAAEASSAVDVEVSKDGDVAIVEGSPFAIDEFSRAQKGTNREVGGSYRGYSYLVGQETGAFVQVVAADDYAVAYVPAEAAQRLGLDPADVSDQDVLKAVLTALDARQAAGSQPLSDIVDWRFTSETSYEVDGVRYEFDQEIDGNVYLFVIGVDGSDLTQADAPFKPSFADFGRLEASDDVRIVAEPTGLEAAGEFFRTLDWSPLWVTLKTTGTAIVFIFVLGLLAAYFCLNVSQRARNIADSLFTIPMVLPPTVCGFVLLWLCGRNTAFGQFFIDIGFPLIFSWPATVVAAVVVAFPLMYRSALGAFESLDPNMLDAARTLGWSDAKIFLRLMLPLSWSSIAAGTVLAFARALGEFGATLFLAGNYLGVTRTIPIAIYFEWMGGNDEVAWFWTAVILMFSFVVILLINLWSSRTTKYRKKVGG
ncbi:molybdenum ABC transporter permease subunit [Gordonibacter sp. An230]|uniref:molybdate ABC transporter permease subunit n=1 Tax=Gordonibacter sp. An230 TaxID=1965592 RepID=UPI000B36EA52|nr:molybdate ABC transporter permease subunit [Gordonibacter sp. An230]OUO89475.1 molybdenum ABC transporter permease subunit [Gordonibacter sp. An230]